jgi:hypothetical protein
MKTQWSATAEAFYYTSLCSKLKSSFLREHGFNSKDTVTCPGAFWTAVASNVEIICGCWIGSNVERNCRGLILGFVPVLTAEVPKLWGAQVVCMRGIFFNEIWAQDKILFL